MGWKWLKAVRDSPWSNGSSWCRQNCVLTRKNVSLLLHTIQQSLTNKTAKQINLKTNKASNWHGWLSLDGILSIKGGSFCFHLQISQRLTYNWKHKLPPLTFYLVSVINSSLDIPISFFYSKCLILQKICLLSCKRYKLFIMDPPIIYLDQLAFHFKVTF